MLVAQNVLRSNNKMIEWFFYILLVGMVALQLAVLAWIWKDH